MKHTKEVMAKVAALWMGVIWVTCSVVVAAFPKFTMTVLSWLTHGQLLPLFAMRRVSIESFVMGGVVLMGLGWFYGYVLGWIWERIK
ncbi:MAG: hypothetical protein A2900_02070 [Candidatus Chisholmbacteria bacterium RIFCSPLOWO2_01_FULL_50_28]|uniref:Uncharacterized protein n=1 Tax=Candidatus Chisholmbacteria bacterium RIFCSPHIGHO2_01_FULL_52_32 TaxID=1797591 RepID=A0A1G1VTS3_9BACT|nr:MAG: hypothetical protein A2786_04675 [Candidatus Chisholmbacteria bacterium RIFCSPHIGHO2_01_FULL_52_32]OGY19870.1 MAG: hypothetical protein A2900_02070 [Candidatus Chisholmbacteria bacterium RIFCSPLOWO2_01_FULL_50_28]